MFLAMLAGSDDPGPEAHAGSGEDIVITGERVPRTLRETASSVAVLTADDLDGLAGTDRLEQVFDLVPNIQAGSGGDGPTIRGQDTTGALRDLPAFLGGNRPRTTLVVDGRAVTYNEFAFGVAPLWDIDRVEIFRSPQTTTQGRNSIAGAIFVHSKPPSAEPTAQARAMVGTLSTRQLSAMASAPLIGDALRFRLSGDLRSSRPSTRIGDNQRGASPDHDRFGQLRARLAFDPGSDTRVDLIYAHSQSQMPQIEGVAAPFRQRRNPDAAYGVFRTNVDSLTASLRASPVPGMEARLILTGGDSHVRRFAPPGLGETQIDGRDWSAEAIASWSPAPTIDLVAGLSHSVLRQAQRIDLSALVGKGRFEDRQEGSGLFVDSTFVVADRLSLSLGLRYQHDRQQRTGAIGNAAKVTRLDYSGSFDAWLPKAVIAYDDGAGMRVGAMIQKAYNPGGVSLRFDTGEADAFAAETLWNGELFARAARPDGSIRGSVNLFYSAMTDAQRAAPIVLLTPTGRRVTFADLYNIPRARSFGLEAEVAGRATGRLDWRAALGLLDTRIQRSSPDMPALEGKAFQRAPAFGIAAGLDWKPVDRLSLSAQWRFNHGYYSDDINSRDRRVKAHGRFDARAAWDGRKATLFAYARNLFDDFAMTYLFSSTFGTAMDPREIGIGVETRFQASR